MQAICTLTMDSNTMATETRNILRTLTDCVCTLKLSVDDILRRLP